LSRFLPALALFLGFASSVPAADFEISPAEDEASPAATSSFVSGGSGAAFAQPVTIDLGDLPTAYAMPKYGLRADLRFHESGGILAKVHLGIFSRLFIGGALNTRNVIGSGTVPLTREDAQVLARLIVLPEGPEWPGLALGWDGPAYERGEGKGLYAVASKQWSSGPALFQLHAGANSEVVDYFEASRDLRAFAGASLAIDKAQAYTTLDEGFHPTGLRWNAGLLVHFNPISLGLEFRDLSSPRNNLPTSRLLRVSYDGHF